MTPERLAGINQIAEELKSLPQLGEDERVLYAWSLEATPDERWARHENFLRSHGLYSHYDRIKLGFSL